MGNVQREEPNHMPRTQVENQKEPRSSYSQPQYINPMSQQKQDQLNKNLQHFKNANLPENYNFQPKKKYLGSNK